MLMQLSTPRASAADTAADDKVYGLHGALLHMSKAIKTLLLSQCHHSLFDEDRCDWR